MNTKQLWQALSSNPVTQPYFDGVFSVDTLKEIKTKPELIICNTDPSNKPGKHWLLFLFHNNTVDYYDSLGYDLDYYGQEFTEFVKKFVKFYQSSKVRTQPKNSALCGYYCLYFAHGICKGVNMDDIINSMKTSTKIVNFVNKMFTFCKFYSSTFQTCIKY